MYQVLIATGATLVGLCLAAAAFVAGAISSNLLRKTTGQSIDHSSARSENAMLTTTELAFFGVLRRALEDQAFICAKTRAVDVLAIANDMTADNKQLDARKIGRHYFDFVLCDTEYMRPQVAIELDDRSNPSYTYRRRAAHIDEVASNAGLPLVRVSGQPAYSVAALRGALAPHLTPALSTDIDTAA